MQPTAPSASLSSLVQWRLQTTLLTLEFINSEMLTQVTGQNEAFDSETRKDLHLPDHFPHLFWIMLPYKQDGMYARPNTESVGNKQPSHFMWCFKTRYY